MYGIKETYQFVDFSLVNTRKYAWFPTLHGSRISRINKFKETKGCKMWKKNSLFDKQTKKLLQFKLMYVNMNEICPCSISILLTGDGKGFPSLDGLRNHINTCHMPKKFACSKCAYPTNQGGHLLRHVKRRHDASASDTGLKKWRHEQ